MAYSSPHLINYLFDSQGQWVAFRKKKHVFDRYGRWIGWTPWMDNEVVTPEGVYLGTITFGNRLYRLSQRQERDVVGTIDVPEFPGTFPEPKSPGRAVLLPWASDLEFVWDDDDDDDDNESEINGNSINHRNFIRRNIADLEKLDLSDFDEPAGGGFSTWDYSDDASSQLSTSVAQQKIEELQSLIAAQKETIDYQKDIIKQLKEVIEQQKEIMRQQKGLSAPKETSYESKRNAEVRRLDEIRHLEEARKLEASKIAAERKRIEE
ncbi:MAG: hypothetical protein IKI22_00435, partial [Neisseriaceae bacterium]|nr:hypothetical protein [Neisseriaceae bacterium]